jgi:hypothetical protein
MIVESLIDLATAVFGFANTKESQQFIKKATQVKLELEREKSKPYDQRDDAKIEALHKEAQIYAQAARDQLAVLAAGK